MKFAATVFAARQLVNHGHILVNGKRVNTPSYRVNEGDAIEVAHAIRENVALLLALDSNERDIPDYMDVTPKDCRGVFTRTPKLGDVPYPVVMEPNLVVEFYSR
ncbi:MAG: hypothetical protein LBQ26_00920 [Holosporales bacterium]|jgi:small subunit ribosomal protein S4|nr:hypothetical protein [Holosporales bacterium]